MKEQRIFILLCFCSLLTFITQAAYADSSWVWLSAYRPYDVLPWVAIATIAIETLAINYIPKVEHLLKTFVTVVLANLASFAAPYLIYAMGLDVEGSMKAVLEAGPTYNVNVTFLAVTVIVELPIVYNVLKKHVDNRKKLLWTIIIANILTTAMVVIIERELCYGHWA